MVDDGVRVLLKTGLQGCFEVWLIWRLVSPMMLTSAPTVAPKASSTGPVRLR